MSVLSSIDVFTVQDVAGNPRTMGWFDYEFQENYATGGVYCDLSPYFRVVRDIIPKFVSGQLHYLPEANEATFDTPASTLIKLLWIGSGQIQVQSGAGVTVLSGQTQPASGYTAIWSGYVGVGSGWVQPPRAFDEIDNGTPVSGTRARLFVLGY